MQEQRARRRGAVLLAGPWYQRSTGVTTIQTGAAPHGTDWQRYVNALLAEHFARLGYLYTPVPDKVRGDGGIEGYSSTGEAFQAYADQGSHSTKDKASKQKKKIQVDLSKLADQQRLQLWTALFQNLRLKSWTLVVPTLEDKTVLVYARQLGAKLRAKQLPFLADDFEARVVEASVAYPAAAKNLASIGLGHIPSDWRPSTNEDVIAFEAAKAQQVASLDRKLTNLPNLADPAKRRTATADLLKCFLDAENLLERTRQVDPALSELIILQKHQQGRRLQAGRAFDDAPPSRRVSAAQESFEQSLR